MSKSSSSPGLRALAAATLALLAPGSALAGDFIDTRLTFLFTDEDVLHGAAETRLSSPAARIGGGRSSTLFFDNYETKYTGFETLSNLVLYKKEETYFQNLTGEAALHATILDTLGGFGFSDSSSYIRLNWKDPTWGANDGISLTAFPVSADRFRLGYSYRISWGGSRVFPGAAGKVPGAKLQLTRGPIYAFVGMKTAQIDNEDNGERETNYGWLAGAGWDILPTLRWELGAGYFQRGVIRNQGLLGEPTVAAGGSTQVAWHVGQPIGTSVDFRLYKNDPDAYERFFKPEEYPGGLSYTVAAEFTYLVQTLQDFENQQATVRQPAMAGDLQAKVKYDKFRFHLTGSYRDLAYVLFNVPSFVPFQDFPDDMEVTPEFFVAGGLDYFFEGLHLTPGLVAGVQLPATIAGNAQLGGSNPSIVDLGQRTVVVRDEGLFEILPAGEEAQAIFSVKGTTRLDLSESFAAAGELYYVYDSNRSTIAVDTGLGTEKVWVFEDPHQLGFNLMLQARF
jgi:opacity protein-like surface antigen